MGDAQLIGYLLLGVSLSAVQTEPQLHYQKLPLPQPAYCAKKLILLRLLFNAASVIEGANAGAAFATQSTGGAFTTTTQTTQVTGTAFGAEGAGFGIEGGDNEGTVGYGTSVIEGANAGAAFATQSTGAAFTTSTEGAGFGIEGGDNAGTVGYGTSVIQGATASSSVVGLPTVPSNNLVSTITPSFLPGPYISAADNVTA